MLLVVFVVLGGGFYDCSVMALTDPCHSHSCYSSRIVEEDALMDLFFFSALHLQIVEAPELLCGRLKERTLWEFNFQISLFDADRGGTGTDIVIYAKSFFCYFEGHL